MKLEFQKPVMNVELFVANQAVSTCTVKGGIEWTFDCMFGPNVDTANVISSQIPDVDASCSKSIGYAGGITTARDYSKDRVGHSDNNSKISSWSKGDGYIQVSYTGAEGLLYTDNNKRVTDSNVWKVDTGYIYHTSSRGGQHHMVAPVIDGRSINASW